MWFSIGVYIASMVLSYLLRPTTQTPEQKEPEKPAGKGDFEFPTVSPGRPIPVVFGTRWVKGPNVVWFGDIKYEPIIDEPEAASGKKK